MFKTLSKNGFEATVIVKGKSVTGYMHKKDIEETYAKQESLRGIALQTVPVYEKASTGSKKYKSYTAGTVLKYKTLSKNWHEAVVYINGKKKTGYIYAPDVEDVFTKQENLRGVSIKTTPVYQQATTNSKKLKTYSEGTILRYKSFAKNWHEAVIYLNGKKTTGYIHATDVETADVEQKDLQGVTFKEKGTNVYSKASTKSKVLKSYAYGTVLKYKSFTDSWYEATIVDNGTKKTAYIHKNDVKSMNYQFTGYAQKNPTHIYADKTKKSQTIKTYDRGSTLKYRAHDRSWNVVTVKVNGEWQTGYLHTDDVHYEMLDLIYKTKYGYDFKAMADRQVKKQPTSDGAGKVKATRGEIEFYTNPANFPKTSAEYYQFLVLSTPAGLDAKQINNKILKGKGSLEGTAQAFINAGKKYSINEVILNCSLHCMKQEMENPPYLREFLVDKTGK